MEHDKEAVALTRPVSVVRDKIIEDKIVIDRSKRKAILCYRVGRMDKSGKLIDTEERTAVFRDEGFDQAIQDVFGSGSELQKRLTAVRKKAKEDFEGVK